jgi:hypothetical protein
MNFIVGHPSAQVPLDPLMITSFTLSMAVNALMTTFIVFKILNVLVVKRTLGATGGTKLQHIIFIIIESGMALFAIQLIRVVLSCLPLQTSTVLAFNLTIGINQMFNVNINISSSFVSLKVLTFTRVSHQQ